MFPSKDISLKIFPSSQLTLAAFGKGWPNTITDSSIVEEDSENNAVVWVLADSLGTVLK